MSGLLAGYISGSTVELARVTEKRGKITLEDVQSYPSRDFSRFDTILRKYLKREGEPVHAGCLGVAGPVLGEKVTTTNLPWHISAASLEKKFELGQIILINDVVASAHGLAHLGPESFFVINSGRRVSIGNQALIAAGVGLGEALILKHGDRINPYASEGGHGDFAPANQIEAELWAYLYSERGQVEVEDIVSLSGLVRIYDFLVDTQGGSRADWYKQAEYPSDLIIEKALSGRDETASRALDIFIDCYASETANLALKGMAIGGVFIGWAIAPQIITALDRGRFMSRFVKTGKMESLLARIPVGVIIEERTPLLGAASVALGL
jgi:glucokinase